MRQAKKSPILGNLEVLENQRKKKHQQDAEVLERLAKRAGLPRHCCAVGNEPRSRRQDRMDLCNDLTSRTPPLSRGLKPTRSVQ